MARKTVQYFKDFNNLDEVFDKMLELGFFVNENQKLEKLEELKNPTDGPFSNYEHWYSNSVVEVKIFTKMFGAFEIRNYRGIIHKSIDELFEVATLPKI